IDFRTGIVPYENDGQPRGPARSRELLDARPQLLEDLVAYPFPVQEKRRSSGRGHLVEKDNRSSRSETPRRGSLVTMPSTSGCVRSVRMSAGSSTVQKKSGFPNRSASFKTE